MILYAFVHVRFLIVKQLTIEFINAIVLNKETDARRNKNNTNCMYYLLFRQLKVKNCYAVPSDIRMQLQLSQQFFRDLKNNDNRD